VDELEYGVGKVASRAIAWTGVRARTVRGFETNQGLRPQGFNEDVLRIVMHDNAKDLSQRSFK
jgi:hypothetical protein